MVLVGFYSIFYEKEERPGGLIPGNVGLFGTIEWEGGGTHPGRGGPGGGEENHPAFPGGPENGTEGKGIPGIPGTTGGTLDFPGSNVSGDGGNHPAFSGGPLGKAGY